MILHLQIGECLLHITFLTGDDVKFSKATFANLLAILLLCLGAWWLLGPSAVFEEHTPVKPAEVSTESPVVAINNSLLDPNIRIGQDVFYIVSEEKRGFSIWMSDTAIGLVRIPDATTKIGVSRRPITEPLIFEPYELGTSVNIEEDSMSGRLGIAVLSIRFETARATVFCTLVRGTRDFSEGRALSCRL